MPQHPLHDVKALAVLGKVAVGLPYYLYNGNAC